MRFPDTLAGWTEQMQYLRSNQYIRNYLKAISKEEMIIVKNRKAGVTGNQPPGMCHENVAKLVKRIGGSAVYGWYVNPYLANDNPNFDGAIHSVFHCNWCTPENVLVNVSPESGLYHIFLPDPVRRYDFNTCTSYNNRTVYLDSYSPPFTAYNPARNVTYFTAGQYASRDRIFERYNRPNTTEEALENIPAHMKKFSNGSLQLSDEGRRWLSLKYSVRL